MLGCSQPGRQVALGRAGTNPIPRPLLPWGTLNTGGADCTDLQAETTSSRAGGAPRGSRASLWQTSACGQDRGEAQPGCSGRLRGLCPPRAGDQEGLKAGSSETWTARAPGTHRAHLQRLLCQRLPAPKHSALMFISLPWNCWPVLGPQRPTRRLPEHSPRGSHITRSSPFPKSRTSLCQWA